MRKALTQIIKSQLTAFRDEDYVTAYTFASAGIKSQYPLAAFERMVKTGFAAIAQFKSAEFGEVLDNGQEAVVNVEIEGESSRVVHYQYFLRKENAGWKISGVIEVKPKGAVAWFIMQPDDRVAAWNVQQILARSRRHQNILATIRFDVLVMTGQSDH
jgi:uncharacterized protein DUF4864